MVLSQNGLLTTVAYKLGPDQPTVYALEVIAKNSDREPKLRHVIEIVWGLPELD